jgi:MFS family permease
MAVARPAQNTGIPKHSLHDLVAAAPRLPATTPSPPDRPVVVQGSVLMRTAQLSTPVATTRRGFIPAGLALTSTAVMFSSLYLAAGALTPLLVVYKQQWDFPAVLLTVAFAAYAVGFLAAVLTLGSLSDFIGRRPVIVGALVIQLVSSMLFLAAPDVGWVVVGRIVQGIASGAGTAAFTAAMVEFATPHRKRFATLLGSVAVTGGLALGSLLAGLAIQLTADANTVTFVVLILLTIVGIVLAVLSPETISRSSGALRALIPRVAVPPAARREFLAAAPVVAAVWMLAGLSGGLAPSMVRSVFHVDSGFLNGLTGFIAPAVSSVVALAFVRVASRPAMSIGIYASIAGPIVIVGGVLANNLAIMILGQAIAGVGFGAAFTAALQLLFPLAAAHQRAAVVAAIYVVSYAGFGIPIVIAGLLTDAIGIVPTVLWYSAVAALLALVSLGGQRLLRRSTRRTPDSAASPRDLADA